MPDKTLVLTIDDINNTFAFVQSIAETKYGDEADTVLERLFLNTPSLQKVTQDLIKEMYKMVSKGVDDETLAKLCANNDVDNHLFDALLGDIKEP